MKFVGGPAAPKFWKCCERIAWHKHLFFAWDSTAFCWGFEFEDVRIAERLTSHPRSGCDWSLKSMEPWQAVGVSPDTYSTSFSRFISISQSWMTSSNRHLGFEVRMCSSKRRFFFTSIWMYFGRSSVCRRIATTLPSSLGWSRRSRRYEEAALGEVAEASAQGSKWKENSAPFFFSWMIGVHNSGRDFNPYLFCQLWPEKIVSLDDLLKRGWHISNRAFHWELNQKKLMVLVNKEVEWRQWFSGTQGKKFK